MKITHCPRGVDATSVQLNPGDFFLVCDWHEDLLGKLIQAGSRVRYGNTDLARWSHAGMIVGIDGSIVEAEAAGIQLNHISKYTHADLYVVNPGADDTQRQLACAFAKAQVGVPYDKLDFVALAFQLLLNSKISIHNSVRFICSGLVSRCTEKYITGYPRSPECMMPSDLADYWNVKTNQPLPNEGLFDKFLNAIAFVTSPLRGLHKAISKLRR